MVEDYMLIPDNDSKFRNKVLGINYKNIEEFQDLIIFTTEEDKKFFVDKRRAHKRITSDQYKDIQIDDTNSNIIYCDTENKTHIYLRNKEGFLAKIAKTNLRYLNFINGTYYFASSKDNLQYDASLISINKQGIVTSFTNNSYHITSIFNPNLNLYLLSNGNYADLVKIENTKLLTLYSNLYLPTYDNQAILYNEGLISLNKNNQLESITNLKKVTYLGNNLYKLWSEEGEGLWYTPLGLIKEPLKDNIIQTLPNAKETFENSGIYVFGVKNSKTNTTELIKIVNQDKTLYHTSLGVFNDSVFLPGNLLVLKKEIANKTYTCLFNKYATKILTLDYDAPVKYISKQGYRDYEVYKIGMNYYMYNGIKLVLINLNPHKDMYIAGVRTILGDIALNTYNPEEFNKWLTYFNNPSSKTDIADTLLKLYTPSVEEKYPNLVRRIK